MDTRCYFGKQKSGIKKIEYDLQDKFKKFCKLICKFDEKKNQFEEKQEHKSVEIIKKNNKGDGFIYCISNKYFKNNIYKIGYTKRSDIKTRINELYNTSVPEKFNLVLYKWVDNSKKKEKELHIIFDKYRINKNREFFMIDDYEFLYKIFENI